MEERQKERIAFLLCAQIGKKWEKALARAYAGHLLLSDRLEVPLFHGTGARLLTMTPRGRARLKENCFTVIDGLLPLLTENRRELEKLPGELYDRVLLASRARSGSELFKYDSVYLTTSWNKALGYAKNGCQGGELFYSALGLAEAAQLLGLPCPKGDGRLRVTLARLRAAATVPGEPVVLCFRGLERQEVSSRENAEDVNWESFYTSYFYVGVQDSFRMREGFSFEGGTLMTPKELDWLRREMWEAYRAFAGETLPSVLRELLPDIAGGKELPERLPGEDLEEILRLSAEALLRRMENAKDELTQSWMY